MYHVQIDKEAFEKLKDYFEKEQFIDMMTWRFRSDTFRKYYQLMDRIIEEGIKALREEKGMDAILDAQEASE